MKLFQSIQIKNLVIKNRIVVPAMLVNIGTVRQGKVSEEKVRHYQAIAEGGAGLIIQESAAVSKEDGKAIDYELDFFCDHSIEEMKKIVDAVHEKGCPIFLQLCHAGVTAIDEQPICPSAYTCTKAGRTRTGREMDLKDIKRVQHDFIEAAKRAVLAGYDGIEIHGCHRYLISQFLNTRVNKRTDEYGRKPEYFVQEIVKAIKGQTPTDFIVGIRIGGFEPTLADSIRYCRLLEKEGIDFFNISYGCTGEFDAETPEGYPLKDIIYAASRIKQEVSVPVFAVNGLHTAGQAEEVLLETNVDMVNIGRSILVDPDWPSHIMSNEAAGRCIDCRQCYWHTKPDHCPGRKLFKKSLR
ncbi:tRNA-dihydrouridine synthase [Lacrimispora sp.]|uniref:oxidoreductase n=1 Tax=Lacrimispora sp. TaxID=2719234 RepID=UPI00399350EB